MARPWPWAAPVTNATFPSNSRLTDDSCRSFHRRCITPERHEVVVQVDLERVVEDVGGEHDAAEGGERDDLRRREPGAELGEEPVRDVVAPGRQPAAELEQRAFLRVQHQALRVLTALDQNP